MKRSACEMDVVGCLVLFFSSTLAVSAALPAQRARACGQEWSEVLRTKSVPANGALYLQFECIGELSNCQIDAPEELEVIDVSDGKKVAGKYRPETPYPSMSALWQPDEPFIEGRTYEVQNAGGVIVERPGTVQAFEVTKSITLNAADVWVSSSSLERKSSTDRYIECSGPMDSCGRGPIVAQVLRWDAMLSVETRGSDATLDSQHGQYLTRVKLTGADGEDHVMDWHTSPSSAHAFHEAAAEYCYELSVRSLIDESEAKLTGCLETGKLGKLGEEILDGEVIDRALSECNGVVDDDDLPRWCEAKRSSCSDEKRCVTEMDGCPDPASSDAGVELQPADESISKDDDDGRACAVTSPRKHTPLVELGALLLGLVFRWRRRVKLACGAR